MNILQVSRRGFLSNLAILSTGLALGSSATGLIPGSNLSPNLEELWKFFCRQQCVTPYSGVLKANNEIIACEGHMHQQGQPVYLAKENIIAQPVWIYWATNKHKPSDLIINLYKKEVAMTSINQFELKAFCEAKEATERLATFLKLNENGSRLYAAQTTIGPNNRISTLLGAVQSPEVLV